ncbi:MAG: hypothetical protein AAFU79_16350 [Myxococcota bacterium]
MKEQDLMKELAQTAEEERMLIRLERYAAGLLSNEDVSRLEAEAKSDPQLSALLRMSRPMPPSAAALAARKAQASVLEDEASPSVRSSRWRQPWLWPAGMVAGALSAALAGVFWVSGEAPDGGLPEYQLEVLLRPIASLRSVDSERTKALDVRSGDRFELRVRPETRTSAARRAFVYFVRGARSEPLVVDVERDEGGAFRIRGQVTQRPGVGAWVVAVGDRSPGSAEILERSSSWRWVEQPVRVLQSPSSE